MRDPAQVAHICITHLRVCFALCKTKIAHWVPISKNSLKRQKKLFLISLLVLMVNFFTMKTNYLIFDAFIIENDKYRTHMEILVCPAWF
jgi:hypothetical protein